jgi:hypothetical protein
MLFRNLSIQAVSDAYLISLDTCRFVTMASIIIVLLSRMEGGSCMMTRLLR